MIRLSRLADYAITIMCEMALHPGKTLSAKYLSDRTAIGESTVMKVLKLLAKQHLLASLRGSKGGYRLHLAPESIHLLAIIEAVDGPVTTTLCSEPHSDACNLQSHCLAKHGWNKVNHALKETLMQFDLSGFINQIPKQLMMEQPHV